MTRETGYAPRHDTMSGFGRVCRKSPGMPGPGFRSTNDLGGGVVDAGDRRADSADRAPAIDCRIIDVAKAGTREVVVALQRSDCADNLIYFRRG